MAATITEYLYHLLDFAEEKMLIEAEDREYTLNRLLEIVQLDAPECERPEKKLCPETATSILRILFTSFSICFFLASLKSCSELTKSICGSISNAFAIRSMVESLGIFLPISRSPM